MTMLERQKYRKKPVVIEAVRYTGDNLAEVLAFTGKHPRFDEWFSSFDEYAAHVASDRQVFKILTLEGTMEASPGDWIIKGVKGEFYPCKPDIFEATYEPALSTVTPAKVGGMVDAQTEARAIIANSRATFASMKHYDDLVDKFATALAAKDAELAAVHQRYVDANEARIDAEAQLAEANKALEVLGAAPSPIQRLGAAISRRDWHEVEQAHAAIRDIVDAARRAREQGGENNG